MKKHPWKNGTSMGVILSIKSQTGKSKRTLSGLPLPGMGQERECTASPKPKIFCSAKLLPSCANATLPYFMYADGRRLLVFVPFLTVCQLVKIYFNKLAPMEASRFHGCFSWDYFHFSMRLRIWAVNFAKSLLVRPLLFFARASKPSAAARSSAYTAWARDWAFCSRFTGMPSR